MRQVDRALAELGYDAQATRRQRERVAETLNARRLLEVDLDRNADGAHTIRYAIWTPGDAQPAWSAKSDPFADAGVANAMRGAAIGARARARSARSRADGVA